VLHCISVSSPFACHCGFVAQAGDYIGVKAASLSMESVFGDRSSAVICLGKTEEDRSVDLSCFRWKTKKFIEFFASCRVNRFNAHFAHFLRREKGDDSTIRIKRQIHCEVRAIFAARIECGVIVDFKQNAELLPVFVCMLV
jgi:hypothetical protein